MVEDPLASTAFQLREFADFLNSENSDKCFRVYFARERGATPTDSITM